MSAESARHARAGGPLTVPSQPPSDRGIIDAVSGFINDVTLSSSSTVDPKDVIQWARFETADINEPTPEGDSENDISPLLLILGYGSGVQVWLIPPSGEAQEVLSWRQGTVRVLRILPTPQNGDCFASKRPLIALCDSASPGPTFCSLSFISIRGGEQVKSIKFKNPILDVLANKRSVVVSFSERFAVFDAATLEDRMAVTTCYPCPCPLGGSLPINPLALGDRWLAYADKKLNQSKRSSGGCEGEGVTSYTATVLHAAKSLSKGLRGLGESVAHSLAGGRSTSQSPSPPNADIQQPGVVTILDIEGTEEEDGQDTEEPAEPIIAHFVAHSEAIIALKLDPSGMLLITADRRGHDFHVFRINPHPCGPSLAAVHHLYILHRGDTTARVQDIAISGDSRWAAISTLRGTTHVFALSAYGGACGVRTHTQPRVVNRLSRFHRSAGLPIHAAHAKRPSGSPVGDGLSQGAWYPNPRLPPYPLPVTAAPLAQLRPTANIPTHTITRTSSGRQRLSSLSEDSNAAPLLARARFGLAACPSSSVAGSGLARPPSAPVAALYLMAANGSLLHLLLHSRPLASVPKEKICDDSPIEVEVEPIAQWPLQRPPAAADLLAPLPPSNPLLQQCSRYAAQYRCADMCMSEEERWLSQVEIVTHAGPHRRLWMGPQFVFKTYNCTGSNSSLSEAETVEVDTSGVARSNPVNMPGVRPLVPILVDSGSASSLEHSPSDSFRRKSLLAETGRVASVCDVQLREDLAEAMKEDHGAAREWEERPQDRRSGGVARAVDPQGTVVQPAPPDPPKPEPDPELYVSDNCDEATFRPVLRAPAPLSARPEAAARPLPRTTTIPVQSTSDPVAPCTPPDPLPLSTAVVIPAALTAWPDECSYSLDKPDEEARELTYDRSKEREGSAKAERGRESPQSLPGSNRPSDDIQPTARPRVKRSPTPKSDDVRDTDASCKNRKSKVKVCSKVEDVSSKMKKNSEQKELNVVKVEKIDIVEPEMNLSVTIVKPRKEIPIVNRLKSTSAAIEEKTTPIATVEIPTVVASKITPVITKDPNPQKVPSNREKTSKVSREKSPSIVSQEITPSVPKLEKSSPVITVDEKIPIVSSEKTTPVATREKSPTSLKASVKETTELKSSKKEEPDIKTEEQAWDMLLNEPEESAVCSQPQTVDKSSEEPKLKSKKVRKGKKCQDDAQAKAEEDTFIKIHAIEEKQTSSGDLVSISTPYEDLEPISYSAKTKKSRKSVTPEKNGQFSFESKDQCSSLCKEKKDICSVSTEIKEYNIACEKKDKRTPISGTKGQSVISSVETNKSCITVEKKDHFDDKDICIIDKPELTNKSIKMCDDMKPKTDFVPEHGIKSKEVATVKPNPDTLKVSSDAKDSITKESSKAKKSKSLSPYSDRKSADKRTETDVTDVYVIDTMKEEFPEILITKGSKIRKSPQPAKKTQDKEIEVEKPVIKSWSSIAASKNVKKEEKITEPILIEKKIEVHLDEKAESSKLSLQAKLIELCKRTDIMVAECDAPSELDFVEEHHTDQDFTPLEPLEFGLDDFKLEVMRDSLLDINDTASPICEINIDSILSTIKETTTKAIESSAFNLIDLEKVPFKKEKGFSVVEHDKIKTQEVKIEEERVAKEAEVMEKSSDDDITSPVVSTDSDKEDKKTGASNISMPSSKQSKSKKSRKKKK